MTPGELRRRRKYDGNHLNRQEKEECNCFTVIAFWVFIGYLLFS